MSDLMAMIKEIEKKKFSVSRVKAFLEIKEMEFTSQIRFGVHGKEDMAMYGYDDSKIIITAYNEWWEDLGTFLISGQ